MKCDECCNGSGDCPRQGRDCPVDQYSGTAWAWLIPLWLIIIAVAIIGTATA
jgi:hypothetical protein